MKRKRNLLLLLLPVILLLGALLLLKNLGGGEADAVESDPDTVVYSVNSSDITALEWTMAGETLSFRRSGDGWVLDGDGDFQVDASRLDDKALDVSSITASRVLADVEDLAPYGLSEPICSLTVTAAGESRTFLFGNMSAVSSSRQYCTDGSGKVYIVGTGVATGFTANVEDFRLAETESSD